MIEGIHCDFSADEMRACIDKTIAHERDKADDYAGQLAGLEAAGMKERGGSVDAIRDLRGRVAERDKRAARLMIIRDHLVAGETYRLDTGDMEDLGFIKSRFGGRDE